MEIYYAIQNETSRVIAWLDLATREVTIHAPDGELTGFWSVGDEGFIEVDDESWPLIISFVEDLEMGLRVILQEVGLQVANA